MGNRTPDVHAATTNPFFQLDRQGGHVSYLLSYFEFKSFYNDPYFKECKVLEHRTQHYLIILKEVSLSNQQELDEMYLDFERRKQRLNSENVIRLRYLMKKYSQALLRDEFKLIMLFDYILIDVFSEARNRIRMNTRFSQYYLSTILGGAVRGYALIEREGIANDKIRLKNMYFGLKDQVPILKVADSNLFPTKSNFLSVASGDSDIEDIFLSPYEMHAYATHTAYLPNPKSGVYSLGIIMLYLCLQYPSRDLYHYPSKIINYKDIDYRLNIVKNQYPLGFYYVLKEMTEKSVDHRVSFLQLDQKLPSNLKNYSPNMTLSMIPKSTQNSCYVKSSVVHSSGMRGPLESNPAIVNTSGVLNSQKMVSSQVVHSEVPPPSNISSQYRPQPSLALKEVNEVYTNGNSYKGQKNAQDQRHGKGKYTYADGSYYYGDWYKNKMFGSGILYYDDKTVEYDGDWKDDMFEGKGILYGKGCDWIKYEGYFKAGKMDGYGTMLFHDGNVYTGSFKNDRPHGKGRMAEKGRVIIGVWDRGSLVGTD